MSAAHVILVPGLLGFEKLGPLTYFNDVQRLLGRPFENAGIDVRVVVLRTLPTSSLQARAARLAEAVAAEPNGKDIMLVGHSTGGLDIRMFLSPGIVLPTTVDIEAAARRVKAAVSVSAPHRGSPLANAVTGLHGQRLLAVISHALTRLLHAKVGRGSVLEWGKIILQLDRLAGVDHSVCHPLTDELHAAMGGDHGLDPVLHEWLHEIAGDTSLFEQLRPGAVERLIATLRDRPDVVLGSVVTRGPRPRLGLLPRRIGRAAVASSLLYTLLYRITAATRGQEIPPLSADQQRALVESLGAVPSRSDNDGLVPSLSQVWGSVVMGVDADHLDLMGYYGGRPGQRGLDMLASGAGFDADDFDGTWLRISRFLLAASSH